MNKIAFKNPKGGTIYLAKIGFDWGAFWGMFLLGGLPFFLRKMNMLGFFCLAFLLFQTLDTGLGTISLEMQQDNLDPWVRDYFPWASTLISFLFSLYLGIRGGKLTARHYVEEGYKCVTKDNALLDRTKAKWDLEL